MSDIFQPEAKFILHGKFKNTPEDNRNLRPIAVASTLKDYLRRKELNRKVSVETIHCNSDDGLTVLVLPDKTRYKNIVPEGVPELIERHVSVDTPEESVDQSTHNE
ncbi:MAG: hypothetical protein ABEK50_18670 [bacterium]